MQQMTFEALEPRKGSAKSAVLSLLRSYPDGLCRRDFAREDIYEVSARIGELEKLGWQIRKSRCDRHNHRHAFVEYSI